MRIKRYSARFFSFMVVMFFVFSSSQMVYAKRAKEVKEGQVVKYDFEISKEVFESKCDDPNASIKNIKKAHEKHKKDLKFFWEITIADQIKAYESFKKYYHEEMSIVQRKKIYELFKTYIESLNTLKMVALEYWDSYYKFVEASKSGNSDVDYKLKKARVYYDKMEKTLDDTREKAIVIEEKYLDEMRAIDSDNVFTTPQISTTNQDTNNS